MICRASEFLLRLVLKLTVPSFSEWDEAMLAELQCIDKPFTALCWALGCVTVVLREVLHGYCLRTGRAVTGFFTFEPERGIHMRNAKITAVTVVAVTLLLFATTNFRQAMSVAAETLLSEPPYGSMHNGRTALQENLAELDRMRQSAEKQNDAKMLAYVAAHDPRPQFAEAAADRAVAIDQKWTWVYYLLAYRDNVPNRDALIAKLQAWDPQNAIVYLLQADKTPSPQPLSPPIHPVLTGTEPWLPLEARAFDCPKYDDYFQQQFDLEREVALASGRSPIKVTYAAFLGSRPIPNLFNMRLYAEYTLAQASTLAETELQARRVSKMGELMLNANFIFQQFIATSIALKGYEKLATVAPPNEQMLIAARIHELHSHSDSRFYAISLGETLAVNAMVIQGSFLLILAAVLTMTGSFAALLLGRRGKGIERLLWLSSATVLVCCVASYVAYLPFTRLLDRLTYMAGPAPDSGLLFAFDGFFAIRYYASTQNSSLPTYAWSALIAALCSTLLIMAFRHVRQWIHPTATA